MENKDDLSKKEEETKGSKLEERKKHRADKALNKLKAKEAALKKKAMLETTQENSNKEEEKKEEKKKKKERKPKQSATKKEETKLEQTEIDTSSTKAAASTDSTQIDGNKELKNNIEVSPPLPLIQKASEITEKQSIAIPIEESKCQLPVNPITPGIDKSNDSSKQNLPKEEDKTKATIQEKDKESQDIKDQLPIKEPIVDKSLHIDNPKAAQQPKEKRSKKKESAKSTKANAGAEKINSCCKSTQTGEKSDRITNSKIEHNFNHQDVFSHIPAFHSRLTSNVIKEMQSRGITIYPSIYEVGCRMLSIKGMNTNVKSLELIISLKKVILEAKPSHLIVFRQVLKDMIQSCADLINECRPASIDTIANIFKYIINAISILPFQCNEDKARQWIIEKLDEFANERIVLAIKKIAEEWKCLIMENDVLLTYGCSDIVELMVEHAFNNGIKFKLIIALGRPDQEAMLMAERLSKKGIDCTFTLITGVPYMLKGVKKILVGCSAMLFNGCLVNAIGTATIACIAKTFHIPFIVCCESYKFLDEVLLNSITKNELGDPRDLSCPLKCEGCTSALEGNSKGISLLNPIYDVTPAHFITILISEVGKIPPTSVPIIIREFKEEIIYEE